MTVRRHRVGSGHRPRASTAGSFLVLLVTAALLVACSSDGDDEGSATTTPGDPTDPDPPVTAPPTTAPAEEPIRLGATTGIVPRPVSVEPAQGSFLLRAETVAVVDDALDGDADDAVDLLRTSIDASAAVELPVRSGADEVPAITFRRTSTGSPATAESYRLVVAEDGVVVEAVDHDGFVWAVQTLLQLLPPEIHASEPQPGTFALPAVTVADAPRFAWRGAMLDVARHYFGPDDVKTYVDELSAYKINRLHLHLSDDQGWRFPVEAYPELTEIGGANEVGGGPGGAYTRDEYRDLVDYARRRGVTVVPEIDTPGHTNAALRSVPDLACDGVAPDPYTGTQVGFSSLCTTSEFTYEWFDTVIGELAEETPGEWIHLGGDESHSTPDAEYQRFVARAAEIVRAHGKTPVGWEEIGHADLAGGETVVQHWREGEPTVAAAEQGALVVLSPAPKVYLDMTHTADGPGNRWAGVVSTETAYGWDPATQVPGLTEDQVLGVEAPLWTELIEDRATIQQRTLPRLPAVAEVGWTAQADRRWDDVAARLATHAARWDQRGWAWTPDPGITWPT